MRIQAKGPVNYWADVQEISRAYRFGSNSPSDADATPPTY